MTPTFKVGDLVRVKSGGRNPIPGIHEVVEVVPAARAEPWSRCV